MRFWVYSGDRPSNGAKELASQDGFLRLRFDRVHKVKANDVVINWGTSAAWPITIAIKRLNQPSSVKTATCKLSSFQQFQAAGVSTPDWTADQDTAQQWAADGSTVVVRNKLTGHSGDGIVIIEKGEAVPVAPLYTKYIFKEKEYRVHVVCGKVVDTARKIKDPNREVVTWKVRSHDNGFIFARNGLTPNPDRDVLAVDATVALGLDFGAVDIIEDKHGKFYVLEINTAPGLEGQTVTNYAEAFRGCES